jgi:hypothetical protein
LVTDALLHHLWRCNLPTFPLWSDLLDALQITTRETRNKNTDVEHILKFITWTLSININLVKIIGRPRSGHKKFCFTYTFQNTLVKLLKPNKFKPIHIINFKKKYYIMNEASSLFPLLMNGVNPQDELLYETVPVRAYQILDILKGNVSHLSFPFTINIYTSYHSVKPTSLEIERNMIGQLPTTNPSDVFHVFLTPDMEKKSVRINALNTIKSSVKFDKHNLFANTKITEGDKTTFYSTSKERVLNQESCVCDHEDTQTFSPPKRYRNLGINQTFISLVYRCNILLICFLVTGQAFKFLLYENLGNHYIFRSQINTILTSSFISESLGMLDESLKQRLKLCSEISFLRYKPHTRLCNGLF